MSRNRIRVLPVWLILSGLWFIVAFIEHVPYEIWLVPPLLFGAALSLFCWVTQRASRAAGRKLDTINSGTGQAVSNEGQTDGLAIKYKRESNSKSPSPPA